MTRNPVFLLALAVVLTGCYQVAPRASQNESVLATPTRLPNLRPAKTIVVDGSAIVGGIARSLARGFDGFTPGYNVQIGTAGTLDGFRLFCDDKTDIQGAIRLMDSGESADCTRNGVEYIQLTIAYDALAVVGDAPLDGCISASELAYIYNQDPAKLTWAGVRAGLPPIPVRIFAPSADSAAAQFFAEKVLDNRRSVRAGNIRELINKGGGIGYLSLTEARRLDGKLPILAVDDGSSCTSPTDQAIWDGSYAFLSRPLYLYLNRESLRRSEVFRFVTYTLSVPGQQHVLDTGFIPAPPKAYRDAQADIDRLLQHEG
jgi:phosphate transport system substrate-binding protein